MLMTDAQKRWSPSDGVTPLVSNLAIFVSYIPHLFTYSPTLSHKQDDLINCLMANIIGYDSYQPDRYIFRTYGWYFIGGWTFSNPESVVWSISHYIN